MSVDDALKATWITQAFDNKNQIFPKIPNVATSLQLLAGTFLNLSVVFLLSIVFEVWWSKKGATQGSDRLCRPVGA